MLWCSPRPRSGPVYLSKSCASLASVNRQMTTCFISFPSKRSSVVKRYCSRKPLMPRRLARRESHTHTYNHMVFRNSRDENIQERKSVRLRYHKSCIHAHNTDVIDDEGHWRRLERESTIPVDEKLDVFSHWERHLQFRHFSLDGVR